MSKIYYITKENLEDKDILHNLIYQNMDLNYYYSDDFSPEFYISLARAGFISVSYIEDNIEYLLPEMQYEYAVLDFQNLHISRKVNKLLKDTDSYSFTIDKHFETVLESIKSYHKTSWIDGNYLNLLKKLKNTTDENFKLISCELSCTRTKQIIAGEIGYIINDTYTSLSGFTKKEKLYNNYGKLQMTLLSKYLEENSFSFWNMGHPYMQYKLDMGAVVYKRDKFLKRWLNSK